jgi:hypothetical protein
MTTPPDGHVITEFIVSAVPFAWSMLLMCLALLRVPCIAVLDRNR